MSDGERFVKHAKAAGIDATIEYGSGQQHIYQIMAGKSSEADASIANAAAWLPHDLDFKPKPVTAQVVLTMRVQPGPTRLPPLQPGNRETLMLGSKMMG